MLPTPSADTDNMPTDRQYRYNAPQARHNGRYGVVAAPTSDDTSHPVYARRFALSEST